MKKILYWVGAGLVCATIYYLSSIPDVRPPTAYTPEEFLWRKLAHMVEYGVLAYFLGKAAALTWPHREGRFLFWGVFLFCVAFAISDEVHQTFVPGRFGKPRDVLLDAIGAFAVAWLLFRKSLLTLRRPSA